MDTRRVALAKQAQKKKIKSGYSTALTLGVTVLGVKLDCRLGDAEKLRNAKAAAGIVKLRNFFNGYNYVNEQVVAALVQGILDYQGSLLANKWDKEALIDSCTTEEQILQITW